MRLEDTTRCIRATDSSTGKSVLLTSGMNIADSFVRMGVLTSNDVRSALGGEHLNTFIGGLYNSALSRNRFPANTVIRYMVPYSPDLDRFLLSKGIKMNQEGGKGAGSKDYRCLYCAGWVHGKLILKEVVRMQLFKDSGLRHKKTGSDAWSKSCGPLVNVDGLYENKLRIEDVPELLVTPYRTEKEEKILRSKEDKRPKLPSLLGGKKNG